MRTSECRICGLPTYSKHRLCVDHRHLQRQLDQADGRALESLVMTFERELRATVPSRKGKATR